MQLFGWFCCAIDPGSIRDDMRDVVVIYEREATPFGNGDGGLDKGNPLGMDLVGAPAGVIAGSGTTAGHQNKGEKGTQRQEKKPSLHHHNASSTFWSTTSCRGVDLIRETSMLESNPSTRATTITMREPTSSGLVVIRKTMPSSRTVTVQTVDERTGSWRCCLRASERVSSGAS